MFLAVCDEVGTFIVREMGIRPLFSVFMYCNIETLRSSLQVVMTQSVDSLCQYERFAHGH